MGLLLQFGLKYWKYVVLFLFLAGIYAYWSSLVSKIDKLEAEKVMLLQNEATYKANQEQLKSSIHEQHATIRNLEDRRTLDQQEIIRLSIQENTARQEAEEIKKKLHEHNLDKLALSKPKWMEKIINNGTKKVFADFEQITDPNTFNEEIK